MITLLSCGLRDKLTFYPDKESEIPEQSVPNFVLEKQIRTIDGENLQAFLFRHDEFVKHPLIIYFHGNAGNLYHRFDYAKRLFEMNQDVLLISYRGYSKSSGKPSEKGIYLDGEAAVDM